MPPTRESRVLLVDSVESQDQDHAFVRVSLVHNETKIGDTLCTLPLILQLAQIFDTVVEVQGAFSPAVRPLLAELPVCFESRPSRTPAVDVKIEIQRAYNEGHARNEHMALSMCRLAGIEAAALPIDLGLREQPSPWLEAIVISPFSGSKNPWYKFWPIARWLELAKALSRLTKAQVYVIGGGDDDWSQFVDAGAIPLLDLALPEVLYILRRARIFLSIDNGISHLAHFGGVQRHVLLYPAILAPNLVANPRAKSLIGHPQSIGVETVLSACADVLGYC